VFGLGFGEMIVLGIVLLVVVGPRELPKLLRSLGRGVAKLRRMSTDLRQQSGIDDLLNEEGIREDLEALRALRGGLAADLMRPARARAARPRLKAPGLDELKKPEGTAPAVGAEYPFVGPDTYGAIGDDEPWVPEPPKPAPKQAEPPAAIEPAPAEAASAEPAPAEPASLETPQPSSEAAEGST
jgi:sec-independent protein translocase protein TatB